MRFTPKTYFSSFSKLWVLRSITSVSDVFDSFSGTSVMTIEISALFYVELGISCDQWRWETYVFLVDFLAVPCD